MDRDDHAELLRVRKRLHRLEGSVLGLGYRLDAFSEQLDETLDFCDKYGPIVDGLIQADELADGIAEALIARRGDRRRFIDTLWGRSIATLTVAGTWAAIIYQLVVK